MKNRPMGRGFALLSIAAVVTLAAACAPTGTTGAPLTHNFTFGASSVFINSSNDKGVCVFGVCVPPADDEPYVINIGFTVQVGKANSATDSVVVGENQWSGILQQGPSEGSGASMTGAASGAVFFPNVPLLDVGDLLNTNNHLEVVGVWSWAMEADLLGVSSLANTAGDAIKAALNETLATGSLPSDTSQIVNSILSAVGDHVFGDVADYLGQYAVPFAGDDGIGSRFYIGLGVTGTLKTIIDAATAKVTFPSFAIPVLTVPPDIDGGAIFSLGNDTFSNQVMTNSGVQGEHTYTYTLTQS